MPLKFGKHGFWRTLFLTLLLCRPDVVFSDEILERRIVNPDRITVLTPWLEGEGNLGQNVATLLTFQLAQTGRQSPWPDNPLGHDFNRVQYRWTEGVLQEQSHRGAINEATLPSTTAQIVIWGSTVRVGDDVVADINVTLPKYSRPGDPCSLSLGNCDLRKENFETWTVTKDGVSISVGPPRRNFSIAAVQLTAEIIEEFSTPEGLPIFSNASVDREIGRTTGKISFREFTRSGSNSLARIESTYEDGSSIEGFIVMPQLSEVPNEFVGLVGGLLQLFRGDWDAAEASFRSVAEDSSLRVPPRVDAYLYLGMIYSQTENFPRAESVINSAMELAPFNHTAVEYSVQNAIAWNTPDSLDRARELLEKNSFLFPVNDIWAASSMQILENEMPAPNQSPNLLAGTVELKSRDGTISLVGELIAFEGATYTVRTQLGELRISAEQMVCSGVACPALAPPNAVVRVAGSEVIGQGLMPLLLSGYSESLDAEVNIVDPSREGTLLAEFVSDNGFGDEIASFLVRSSNSTDAFSSLLDQSAEIGLASRRITPDEARALQASGAGLLVNPNQEQVFALDGVIAIVHRDNPISEVTTSQLIDIYAGEISNWSEVGGEDISITVVGQENDSDTRNHFEQRLFVELTADAQLVDDSAEALLAVRDDKAAISLVGYAFQDGVKPLTLINECGIAMVPDDFSLRAEEYLLSQRLYLYNRIDNFDETARSFVNFIKSGDADSAISKAGFINLGVDRRQQAVDSYRVRALLESPADPDEERLIGDMVTTMTNFDRLSTTFRFRTGSTRLDERGRTDMLRLIQYLEAQPSGAEVIFVGFTDAVGESEANRQLAEARAAQVRDELLAASDSGFPNINVSSVGYGEISPVACNTSDQGRRINRRVEVWVR